MSALSHLSSIVTGLLRKGDIYEKLINLILDSQFPTPNSKAAFSCFLDYLISARCLVKTRLTISATSSGASTIPR